MNLKKNKGVYSRAEGRKYKGEIIYNFKNKKVL